MKKMIILLFLASLFGLPRFSVEESSSCMNCHINPTGGGMRNDHGTNVYNLDELTLRNWISDGDEVNVYDTKPDDKDSDEDGLEDGDEININGTKADEPDSDGDGLNDLYFPVLHGIDNANYQLVIFNRWGEKVFESNSISVKAISIGVKFVKA